MVLRNEGVLFWAGVGGVAFACNSVLGIDDVKRASNNGGEGGDGGVAGQSAGSADAGATAGETAEGGGGGSAGRSDPEPAAGAGMSAGASTDGGSEATAGANTGGAGGEPVTARGGSAGNAESSGGDTSSGGNGEAGDSAGSGGEGIPSEAGAGGSGGEPPAGPSEAIVFRSNALSAEGSGTGNYEIWIMDTNGQNPRPLTDTDAEQANPELSPSGDRLLWEGLVEGNRDIWVANSDGSNPESLTWAFSESDARPEWAGSGDEVAFVSRHPGPINDSEEFLNLWRIGSDGLGNAEQLIDEAANVTRISWHPNGKFAYISDRAGKYDLWVADSIENLPGENLSADISNTFEYVAIAPNAVDIAVVMTPESGEDHEIFLFTPLAEGGFSSRSLVMNATEPAWSPDGSKMVYTSDAAGQADIWMMGVTTFIEPINLTENLGNAESNEYGAGWGVYAPP